MSKNLFQGRFLAAAAFVLLAAAPALAQPNTNAPPRFGTLDAAAEPAVVSIEAGGPDRNPIPGSGCSGYITTRTPTALVQHTGGVLSIYATSGIDTTLLVADPSGRWQCSDDASGSNPGVTFASGEAGTYTVWVGTFSAEAAGASARLSAVRGQPRW